MDSPVIGSGHSYNLDRAQTQAIPFNVQIQEPILKLFFGLFWSQLIEDIPHLS